MGWWGYDIMAGDTPMDVECEYDDAFQSPPNASEALQFIAELTNRWPDPVVAQVVGYLLIRDGVAFCEETRSIILDGLDNDQSSDWDNGARRSEEIAKFFDIVVDYRGGKVELPVGKGLIETILDGRG